MFYRSNNTTHLSLTLKSNMSFILHFVEDLTFIQMECRLYKPFFPVEIEVLFKVQVITFDYHVVHVLVIMWVLHKRQRSIRIRREKLDLQIVVYLIVVVRVRKGLEIIGAANIQCIRSRIFCVVPS